MTTEEEKEDSTTTEGCREQGILRHRRSRNFLVADVVGRETERENRIRRDHRDGRLRHGMDHRGERDAPSQVRTGAAQEGGESTQGRTRHEKGEQDEEKRRKCYREENKENESASRASFRVQLPRPAGTIKSGRDHRQTEEPRIHACYRVSKSKLGGRTHLP